MARVASGFWGLGITIWLVEHDRTDDATCDSFARGIWPFANPHGAVSGLAGGVAGFGSATSRAGTLSRAPIPGFEFVQFVTPTPDGDSGDDGDVGDGEDTDEAVVNGIALLPHGDDGFDSDASLAWINGPTGADLPNGDNDDGPPQTLRGLEDVEQSQPVPEPGSLLLMGTGFAAWRATRRRRPEGEGREV